VAHYPSTLRGRQARAKKGAPTRLSASSMSLLRFLVIGCQDSARAGPRFLRRRPMARGNRPTTLNSPFGGSKMGDDRAHRLPPAHILSAHQNLHRLGIGVEFEHALLDHVIRPN